MKRAMLVLGLALLTACGVDGPPVPPGQDNPATVSDPGAFEGPF